MDKLVKLFLITTRVVPAPLPGAVAPAPVLVIGAAVTELKQGIIKKTMFSRH